MTAVITDLLGIRLRNKRSLGSNRRLYPYDSTDHSWLGTWQDSASRMILSRHDSVSLASARDKDRMMARQNHTVGTKQAAVSEKRSANKAGAGDAERAPRFQVEHHWPGAPEKL